LEAALKKTRAQLDRYYAAFEEGSMSGAACGPRVKALNERLADLEGRQAELSEAGSMALDPLSDDELHELQARVRQIIQEADRRQTKALLQALVQQITIVSRDEIYPFFAVPTVRLPSHLVE